MPQRKSNTLSKQELESMFLQSSVALVAEIVVMILWFISYSNYNLPADANTVHIMLFVIELLLIFPTVLCWLASGFGLLTHSLLK